MELLFPLLIAALLIPMFLSVRRQKKEMQKTHEMQSSLKIGDGVITTSGLWGTIVELDEESVDLEIAEDVVTTWSRAAIREVRAADTDSAEAATPDESGESTGDTPTGDTPKLTKD